MVLTLSVVPTAGSRLLLLPIFDRGCFMGGLPQQLDYQLWNAAAAHTLAFLSLHQLLQEPTFLPKKQGHLHAGGASNLELLPFSVL